MTGVKNFETIIRAKILQMRIEWYWCGSIMIYFFILKIINIFKVKSLKFLSFEKVEIVYLVDLFTLDGWKIFNRLLFTIENTGKLNLSTLFHYTAIIIF